MNLPEGYRWQWNSHELHHELLLHGTYLGSVQDAGNVWSATINGGPSADGFLKLGKAKEWVEKKVLAPVFDATQPVTA